MIRRPPRSTRTDTLFPYTTLFRSYKIIANSPKRAAPAPRHGKHFNGRRKKRGQSARTPRNTPKNRRSEEHTSELQSLMRISYAVFCLKKKTTTYTTSKLKPVKNTHTNQ